MYTLEEGLGEEWGIGWWSCCKFRRMVTEFFRFISGWASIISKDDRDGLEFFVGGSGKGGKRDGCKGNKTRRDKAGRPLSP